MRSFKHESWPTIMVIGAFCSGVLLAEFPDCGDWKPKWEMVSALGTIAATVTALWISLRERWTRDHEAYVRAQLTAARISGHLITVSGRLSFIPKGARDCIETSALVASRDKLLEELSAITLDVSEADLLALEPLPKRSAFLLAGAKGNLATAKNALSMVCGRTYPEDRERINSALSIVAFLVAEAHQQIENAMYECQEVSLSLTSPHH